MLELQCFTSSIANTVADQQINALSDGRVPTRDNAIVISEKTKFMMLAWFFGTNLTIAKLKPPSYRNLGDYFALPVANATPGAGAMFPALDLRENPLDLDPGDELPVYGQQGSAGPQQAYGFVLLSSGLLAPVKGKHYSVRATATTTLTANAWTPCTLTMDTGLPRGRYAVIGARAKSAGGLAFRLIFPDQNNRPGGICNQGDLALTDYGQRRGGWGEWGQFDNLLIPTLEMLSTSADTAETLIMDLIKIA